MDLVARLKFFAQRATLSGLVLTLFGCNSELADLTSDPNLSIGMSQGGTRLVASNGNRLFLGSQDFNSKKSEEWPMMPTSFSYNFSLDSIEITQGHWRQVMGESHPLLALQTANDALPMVQVTWFDAVLFCNARSKKNGLDTVYSYARAVLDAKGHAIELQGLKVDWSRLGFRLPTEAEWQWSATEGGKWNGVLSQEHSVEIAWNSHNSQGTLHPVATKKPNRLGFYDLFGNAMEWTFDWMGSFREVEVQNFAGASNPNRWMEKVVKGGAYVSAWSQLRAAARSSTYPMTAATSTEYLGFRCVIGPLAKMNFLSPSGQSQTPLDPVTVLDSTWLKQAHVSKARLALVRMVGSERFLQTLEFKQGKMKQFELRDYSPVFTPSISPDGQWVAFGDGFEGMKSKGTVRVCDIHLTQQPVELPIESAYIPRWRVDAVTGDTSLVVSSNGLDNTQPGFGAGETFQIKMAGGKPVGPAIRIAAGAFHDGLSSDGQWLVSGYRHLKAKNLVSGEEKTLFTASQNGKANEDTSQVCNLSMRPGRGENAILFLDFGSQTPSTLVGKPYAIHEVAFLSKLSGEVQSVFWPPTEYTGFQDLEWSTDTGYAVSVLQSDAHPFSTVGILDLQNGKASPFLRAEGVTDPHLWLTTAASPSDSSGLGDDYLDSLGRYSEPYLQPMQHLFAAKLEVLIKHQDSAEIICVGTSESDMGIQPKWIQSGKAINLAVSSSSLATQIAIAKNYAVGHMPKLKTIVFEVFLGSLPIPGGDYHFNCCIEPSRGYQYDRNHGFWPNGFPAEMIELAQSSNALSDFGIDSLGGISRPGAPWIPGPPLVEGNYQFKADDSLVQANLQTIQAFVSEMNAAGIAVLLVQLPEYPGYANLEYVTRGGPSRTEAQRIHQQIQGFCDAADRCAYFDAHQDGHNDYQEFDFFDWNHLSEQGAQRFTPRLDSAISDLMRR
jgi:uncharacterized protein (TIGR02171 family)